MRGFILKYLFVYFMTAYCLLKARSENYTLCSPLKLVRLEVVYGFHCTVALKSTKLAVLAKLLISSKSQ